MKLAGSLEPSYKRWVYQNTCCYGGSCCKSEWYQNTFNFAKVSPNCCLHCWWCRLCLTFRSSSVTPSPVYSLRHTSLQFSLVRRKCCWPETSYVSFTRQIKEKALLQDWKMWIYFLLILNQVWISRDIIEIAVWIRVTWGYTFFFSVAVLI